MKIAIHWRSAFERVVPAPGVSVMRYSIRTVFLATGFAVSCCHVWASETEQLLKDPSFEVTKEKDQFGLVFARWGGWKYEGDCEFRVGQIARSGKHSCLLKGGVGAKIRVSQNVML